MGLASNRFTADSPIWPLLAVGILLTAQTTMVFTRAINWDEFFYYAQVHEFVRGELAKPLNTIHVRYFGWLTRLPLNSVGAIVIGRIVMFVCETITLAMIYAITRAFTDKTGALLAVLLYISSGYVLQHGFSFRIDPQAAAALTVALAVLARCRLSSVSIAGFALAVGLAGMLSIKVVLYAPAFAGLAWMRLSESGFSKDRILRLGTMAVAALGAFCVLYLAHSSGLASDIKGGTKQVQNAGLGMLASSKNSMFFLGIPPYWPMLKKGASIAIIFTILIALAPIVIARSKYSTGQKVALAGLWLPILAFFFYRNTAPYFHAFILPPVAVSAVSAVDWFRDRFPAMLLTGCLFVLATGVVLKEDREVLSNQRKVIQVAETIFDHPVAYIDHNGMLARYRKVNGFLTPWKLEGYHAAGKPEYRSLLEAQSVPLLLENDELLTRTLRGDIKESELLPDDREVLRQNYIVWWGPIWLAGKALPAQSYRETEILVPGRYRIEGSPLVIDGHHYGTDSTVQLDRGRHRIDNPGKTQAQLIWAGVAKRPVALPPAGCLQIGF